MREGMEVAVHVVFGVSRIELLPISELPDVRAMHPESQHCSFKRHAMCHL